MAEYLDMPTEVVGMYVVGVAEYEQLARQRAECERLKAERDDARNRLAGNDLRMGDDFGDDPFAVIDALRGQKATAERERDEAREAYRRFIKDACDTDDQVRTQAKRVLPEATVEGDSYYVPSMGELAKMLADEVVKARAALGRAGA